MTVRAISHQIVIAIQSTFDGSILTTLWTFYFLAAWWLSIRLFHASTHAPPPVQQPAHSPAAKIQISFVTEMPWFCIYYCICSSSAALTVSCFLASVQPPYWCSCVFYRYWTVAVIVACWQLVARISSRIGRIFRKYSAQIWSTDQRTAEIIWLKLKRPDRMVLPHSDSILSPICRV